MRSISKAGPAGIPVNRRWFVAGLGAITTVTAAACFATGIVRPSDVTSKPPSRTMKIRFDLDGKVLTATLNDSAAARDFVALLPLTLTLNDYASTEKISDLPKRLSTQGAPASIKPLAGDITYYAPWGNVALFYRDGQQSSGLIKLGKFDSELDAFSRPGSISARVELLR